MRNQYFDGVDPMIRARQMGATSLRIDAGSTSKPSYQIRAERAVADANAYSPAAPTSAQIQANESAAKDAAVRAVMRRLGIGV